MSMNKERPPLEEMTLRQLRRVASEFSISRYSRMRKDQLITAIQSKMQQAQSSPTASRTLDPQEEVEAAKYELGQSDIPAPATLVAVDDGLMDLPDGYGESRIMLMPRDPQWAFVYWDIPNEHKAIARAQGGIQLALRICDVTDISLDYQRPHSVQEYPCDELAREWYLPIPVSDRDYVAEIGYRCADGRWVLMTRSTPVRIPPVYPSDWIEDIFATVPWEADLRGAKIADLKQPTQKGPGEANEIYGTIFGMAEGAESQRVAGSLFGSMHQTVPGSVPAGSIQHLESLSSYVFPSGVGMWAIPTESGIGALTTSGMGMMTASGMGMFSASAAPAQPRKFWLVADAELIVYGATEPDATVTIGGQPIKLNSDGTFRFQMSFQDGVIDYPILAVAADGEQNRSIHMKFERQTPSRRTNTKEEAVLEWLP